MPMKWFSALVVQQATHPDEPNDSPLFEADIILVRAATEGEAQERAAQVAKSSEHEYRNAYGQRVAWIFKEVLDVKEVEVESIQDGTEVYHIFLNRAELQEIRRALEPPDNEF